MSAESKALRDRAKALQDEAKALVVQAVELERQEWAKKGLVEGKTLVRVVGSDTAYLVTRIYPGTQHRGDEFPQMYGRKQLKRGGFHKNEGQIYVWFGQKVEIVGQLEEGGDSK